MKWSYVVCLIALLVGFTYPADAETEFICEFTSKTISCPMGKTLDIKFANYGRIGHNVCMYRGGSRVNNCYDESHTEMVGRMCDGQPSCTLPAVSELFSDTCPGVLKYLQVKFHCV